MRSPIDLPEVTIRWVAVSDMSNNVYVLTSRSTGRQVLVDAADEPEAIRALLAEGASDADREAVLDTIVTTHRHWDHVRALPDLAGSATLAAGEDDAEAIAEDKGVTIGRRLGHGDTLDGGGYTLEVIHLRGHTPGSIALLLRSGQATVLLTGDSLFPGGPGKTTSAEAFASLMDDLEARVFAELPDATVVLPGHGDPTTLGAERGRVGEWRARGW